MGSPITPKALSERTFSKVMRGYNCTEVDEYIANALDNYAYLYRENIELAKRLAEATSRLEHLDHEEEAVRQTLQTAKRAGDQIIADAYVKADDILASIKNSCDAILRNFRDKVETQKSALADIQQHVLTFKNELFEKYRLHIELIEQLSPVYEYEEELSPDEYVDKVVSGLKREVAAQYDISLESLAEDAANAALSESEPTKTVEAGRVPPQSEPLSATEKRVITPPAPPQPFVRKQKGRIVPSVMDLLDEYEDRDLLAAAQDPAANDRQLMLDLDGENGGSPVFSGK